MVSSFNSFNFIYFFNFFISFNSFYFINFINSQNFSIYFKLPAFCRPNMSKECLFAHK